MNAAIPVHRSLPPPDPENRYVVNINAMREHYSEAVKRYEDRVKVSEAATQNLELDADADVEMKDSERPGAPNPYERPTGPIALAIKEIEGFVASGSDWTTDHLENFQVVVLENQTPPGLFPGAFLTPDHDPTMTALREDGFLTTDAGTIKHGRWDTSKSYNPVFLWLMQLSRGGSRTPSPRTSPPTCVSVPRYAREIARDSINEVRDSSSSSVSSSGSDSSFTSEAMSLTEDLGPRETLSFILLHNLLTYLGTVEHQKRPASKLWINWYKLGVCNHP